MSISTTERPLTTAAQRRLSSKPPIVSSDDVRERNWFATGVSYGSSILLHLLLILLLATMLFSLPSTRGELAINAAMRAGDGGGAEPRGNVPFEVPPMNAVGAPNLSDVAASAANHTSQPGLGTGPTESSISLAGVNVGNSGGTGSGRGGPSVGFFGTKEAGGTFVFVVDSSGSMQGGRFDRALNELRKSIKDLKSWQKFCIIFFNDAPIPLFHPISDAKLYASTSAQRIKANKWMAQVQPAGGTEPAEALKKALDMRPDVIFFLTDGQFDPATRQVVKNANRYKTIIHTIAFESRDGEALLKGIAEDNGGRYRYVP